MIERSRHILTRKFISALMSLWHIWANARTKRACEPIYHAHDPKPIHAFTDFECHPACTGCDAVIAPLFNGILDPDFQKGRHPSHGPRANCTFSTPFLVRRRSPDALPAGGKAPPQWRRAGKHL